MPTEEELTKPDPTLSWEDRYKQLERHHQEETTMLIEKVEWYIEYVGKMKSSICVVR